MHAIAQQERRETLDNGATILMLPVPGTGQIGVESFYRVGFVHEPAGLPQAAHLLEHLVCNAATPGYGAGESMAVLNEMGLANAETLPDWTHYDYMVPAGELATVMRIEAERLSGLRIDEAIIAQEGPRCCREVDFVERNPEAGMLKFAFMALAQAWRHGVDEVTIRSGLDAYAVEALERFHKQTYRPEKLTLVIVGDFDADEALELAREHLDAIENPAIEPVGPIDWSNAPKRSTVRWDSSMRAVCIAFPPPDDAFERQVLSLWGSAVRERLASDAEISAATYTVFTPNHSWPVGDLPFSIYAAVRPGSSPEEVEAMIIERFNALLDEGAAAHPVRIAAYARGLTFTTQRLNEPALRQVVKFMQDDRGEDPGRAMAMALGQGAINWGTVDHFLGPDAAATVKAMQSLTPEQLEAMLKEHFSPERMIVTHIAPNE